jgi:hypothetical protein
MVKIIVNLHFQTERSAIQDNAPCSVTLYYKEDRRSPLQQVADLKQFFSGLREDNIVQQAESWTVDIYTHSPYIAEGACRLSNADGGDFFIDGVLVDAEKYFSMFADAMQEIHMA